LWPFRRSKPKIVVPITGPGTFDVDVVGESHYQDNLEEICGGRTEESVEIETDAYLVPEDDSPADRNAVSVWIDGRQVGHLDRETAPAWRMEITRHGPGICTAKCRAVIVGGWDRGPDDRGHFGVRLDLPGSGLQRRSRRREKERVIASLALDLSTGKATVSGMTQNYKVRLECVEFKNADGSSRSNIIASCNEGDEVELVREPNNPHDKAAIAVYHRDRQIGYLPAGDRRLAAHIDAGIEVHARITRISERPTEAKPDRLPRVMIQIEKGYKK